MKAFAVLIFSLFVGGGGDPLMLRKQMLIGLFQSKHPPAAEASQTIELRWAKGWAHILTQTTKNIEKTKPKLESCFGRLKS